jgi:hypothetical protein
VWGDCLSPPPSQILVPRKVLLPIKLRPHSCQKLFREASYTECTRSSLAIVIIVTRRCGTYMANRLHLLAVLWIIRLSHFSIFHSLDCLLSSNSVIYCLKACTCDDCAEIPFGFSSRSRAVTSPRFMRGEANKLTRTGADMQQNRERPAAGNFLR